MVGQILTLLRPPADTKAICELVQPELYAYVLQKGTHVGDRVSHYFTIFLDVHPQGFGRYVQAVLLADSAFAEVARDDVVTVCGHSRCSNLPLSEIKSLPRTV